METKEIAARSADSVADCPVILNVEDFEPARFLRSRVLRSAGFEVVEADSADVAMQLAAAKTLQLALVDVDLPDGNGFSVCDALKHTYPSLPVLLISAVHVSAWDRHAAQNTCADGYLIEPLPALTLLRRVSDALCGIQQEPSQNWVVTDVAGSIADASPPGAHMLGISAAHLRRRSILMFFERDREEWRHALHLAAIGQIVRRSGSLRPRDRRPLTVDVEIAAEPNVPRGAEMRWIFSGPQIPEPSS